MGGAEAEDGASVEGAANTTPAGGADNIEGAEPTDEAGAAASALGGPEGGPGTLSFSQDSALIADASNLLSGYRSGRK
jgi:hypothetical protein